MTMKLVIALISIGTLGWLFSLSNFGSPAPDKDDMAGTQSHFEVALGGSEARHLDSTTSEATKPSRSTVTEKVINIGPDLPPPGGADFVEKFSRFTHFLDVVSVGEDIPTDHIDAESYFQDELKSVGDILDADNPERTHSNDDPINIGPDLNVEAPIVDHKISEPISIGQYLPIPQY